MTQPVISIRNLSKKYTIYHQAQGAYDTLVETLTLKAKDLVRCLRRCAKGEFRSTAKTSEDFWALNDVNLDIEAGDRVGIIGRNGAGKSTLLKLISRITHPTKGSIQIKGKVSSLLEVGTGFHLELTGRENIFLNGSILGMRKKEIQKQFDEIVAFSGVEQFLDTPVKRYSSGMYTRLGFAIAAHMNPDILIVDEVLAVGDTQFQQKCLKKLDELGQSGRTVLFVSHDVGSVLSLCNKGVYLVQGKVHTAGMIDDCLAAYSKNIQHTMTWSGAVGDENVTFKRAEILSPASSRDYFVQGEPIRIRIDYDIINSYPNLYVGVVLLNLRNQILAKSQTHDLSSTSPYFVKTGPQQLEFVLNSDLLYEGEYLIRIISGVPYKKQVVTDGIELKMAIFQTKKNTQIQNEHKSYGIYLGNHWKHS